MNLPAVTSLSLVDFLNQVSGTLKNAMPGTYWVHAELLKVDKRNYYSLELGSYDTHNQKAKARGMIWESNSSIVRKFEQVTGATLKPGIKILFLCTVQFHPEYGFSLIITDIDPRFSLGDMEAKLQAIRSRLSELCEIDKNRQLAPPREFCRVAVISPIDAAGLGDFKSQSNQLETRGLCEFDYYPAQFQGSGVADSLIKAMTGVVQSHQSGRQYDSLVIIRGGGDKAGLYQLNEIRIARGVCRCPIPVLVGIGHERDTTILDEVANIRCSTPSLVISHIQSTIIRNARNARINMELLKKNTISVLAFARQDISQTHTNIQHSALMQLSNAKRLASDAHANLHYIAREQIMQSKQVVRNLEQEVKYQAETAVQTAKYHVVRLNQHLRETANSQLNATKRQVYDLRTKLHYIAKEQIAQSKQTALNLHKEIEYQAETAVQTAKYKVVGLNQNLRETASMQLNTTRQQVNDSHTKLLYIAREQISQSKQAVRNIHQDAKYQAETTIQAARYQVAGLIQHLRLTASKQIDTTKQQVNVWHNGIKYTSREHINQSKQMIVQYLQQDIQHKANTLIQFAKYQVAELNQNLRESGKSQLNIAKSSIVESRKYIINSAQTQICDAKNVVGSEYQQLYFLSHQLASEARHIIKILIEQVLLQDPKKILTRGFTIIKTPDGQVITTCRELQTGQEINILFNDGNTFAYIGEIIDE